MTDPPVVLAAIVSAHGVAGEVRLKLFAQNVDSVARHRVFEVGGRTLTLLKVRDAAAGPVACFAEVTTRSGAEALRGATLAVLRGALPPPEEGEVYVADLMGLPATANGACVGHVVGHENFGAGDLIEVETPDKRRFLVPFARCEPQDGALAVDPAFIA